MAQRTTKSAVGASESLGRAARGRDGAGVQALLPIGFLLALASLLVAAAVGIDSGFGDVLRPSAWLNGLDRETALDRIANAAEVVAGVLAIAITVVAIVVELAANRYTHRITTLFIREPTNAIVLGFFVLTTVVCLWLSATPYQEMEEPRTALVLAMGMVTVCLLALLPYFAFLFRFLGPRNVIRRIREQARDAMGSPSAASRDEVLDAIAELEDITRGARQQRDRSIAMAAADALAGLARDSLDVRNSLPASWFRLDGSLARDPDFVALSRAGLLEVEEGRTWLETKVLRQYLSLFEESLGTDRDLGNLIALNTRVLAIESREASPALHSLCVRFFNSFLRFAIRRGDLRAAYYVMHQYRGLAEDLMDAGDAEGPLRIAGYLHEYGSFGFEMGQPFLLEVVAYDLAAMVESAAEHLPEAVDPLLTEFLEVDRDTGVEGERELRLRGVRRAQVQLATFFLTRSDEARARRIFEDMKDEDPERLAAVRAELEADQPEQYWEFTDRGINFSYLSPERREQLAAFFGWLTP